MIRGLVRNLGLEQRSTFSRRGRSIGYFAQRGELSELKREFPFFREVPHHCLQEALVDLDKAFANFFAGRAAYPKRHRKRDGVSFRFPDPTQFSLEGDTTTPDKRRTREIRAVVLHLPKAGAVRAVMPRALPPGAVIKSVTIASSGDWWVASLLYQREIELPKDRSQEVVVGADIGVCQPVATSTGAIHALPPGDGAHAGARAPTAQSRVAPEEWKRQPEESGARPGPGSRPDRRAGENTPANGSPRISPKTTAWSRWRA